MVSGSISLPSPGFFSSFPHGTCPLSVANSYLALDRGRPSFQQDFSCPAVLRYCTGKPEPHFVYGDFTLSVRLSQNLSTMLPFYHSLNVSPCSPTTPVYQVWALPISLATTFGISSWFLFLELLRWFSSLSIALPLYFIQERNDKISLIGLPHSAISGSQDMCSSPKLFAAYHGLLRRLAPRHPP